MGFPDRIERTVVTAAPPAAVWTAITTGDGLASWFGQEASIDLRPGGRAEVTWTGEATAELRVERVEEPSVFGFTWRMDGNDPDDPRRSYVEFTLVPDGAGTRLTVVETGFAQLPDDVHRRAHESHTEGWARELGELVDAVDAAA